jgi:hypothetical protein
VTASEATPYPRSYFDSGLSAPPIEPRGDSSLSACQRKKKKLFDHLEKFLTKIPSKIVRLRRLPDRKDKKDKKQGKN